MQVVEGIPFKGKEEWYSFVLKLITIDRINRSVIKGGNAAVVKAAAVEYTRVPC